MRRIIDRCHYAMQRSSFRNLQAFCLFVGYPRSGHSLLGALMDAHPDMLISHEEDVFEWMLRGYRHREIYYRILSNSRQFARDGRSWSGYSYEVSGQWQGSFDQLRVIGDKRGGRTSLLLIDDYSLLHRFVSLIPLPVKIIHVVRNPFDNIVTRARQGQDVNLEITEEAIQHNIRLHFLQAGVVSKIVEEGLVPVHTLRHEDLIKNPPKVLEDVCGFFQMDAPEDWKAACSNIVFDNPNKTRNLYLYKEFMVKEIYEKMRDFDFFDGYTFED